VQQRSDNKQWRESERTVLVKEMLKLHISVSFTAKKRHWILGWGHRGYKGEKRQRRKAV